MDFSTTLSSTFIDNASEDVSWSNLQCNWDTFSFEAELGARSQFAAENFQNLRAPFEEIDIPEECEDVNDLENIISDFNAAKTHNQKLLSDASDIRDTTGELRKKVFSLTTKSQCLQKHIEDLEKEQSLLQTEYKHQRVAYQKALQKYSTHFDINIDITDRTASSVKAIIKFGCPTNSQPIKIIVDKNKRKIIRLDSAGILSREEEESMSTKESIPETICKIREISHSENRNNSMQNI